MQANINMVDNNNNRKSKRNFSLEKPIERHFDIEKEVETAPAAPATPAKPTQVKPDTSTQQKSNGTPHKFVSKPQGKDVPPTTPIGDNNGGDGGNNSMKWIVIVLVVAAIAACVYFFMNGNKSKEGPDTQTLQVEQNDNNSADSIANSDNENKDGITGEDNEATGESEINSQDQSNNSYDPVSQSSTSVNTGQPTRNSAVNQGTTFTQSASSASDSSIEQKARDVWRGVYGNNPDRRKNLGSDYEAVQKLVNEMYCQRLN